MGTKRPLLKKVQENVRGVDGLPDVALAAISSYKKQKEVSDFINFMLAALEHNASWLNNVVEKQSHFRCALMTGAGPNRFQIQEIIYPSTENQELKLEVELNECEDHDKVAIAALLKLSSAGMDGLMKYIKTRIHENPSLREDLLKGKAMGITLAILRPLSEKQYRVMERIVIGSGIKFPEPTKKRRREDKSLADTIMRKTRRKV